MAWPLLRVDKDFHTPAVFQVQVVVSHSEECALFSFWKELGRAPFHMELQAIVTSFNTPCPALCPHTHQYPQKAWLLKLLNKEQCNCNFPVFTVPWFPDLSPLSIWSWHHNICAVQKKSQGQVLLSERCVTLRTDLQRTCSLVGKPGRVRTICLQAGPSGTQKKKKKKQLKIEESEDSDKLSCFLSKEELPGLMNSMLGPTRVKKRSHSNGQTHTSGCCWASLALNQDGWRMCGLSLGFLITNMTYVRIAHTVHRQSLKQSPNIRRYSSLAETNEVLRKDISMLKEHNGQKHPLIYAPAYSELASPLKKNLHISCFALLEFTFQSFPCASHLNLTTPSWRIYC